MTASDPDEPVTVYTAENPTEAFFVRNLLIEEGITATVAEDHLGLPVTPDDVLVKRRDEPRAQAVVDRYDEDKIRRANLPSWTCPACGAKVEGSFDYCDVCDAAGPGAKAEDMSE